MFSVWSTSQARTVNKITKAEANIIWYNQAYCTTTVAEECGYLRGTVTDNISI